MAIPIPTVVSGMKFLGGELNSNPKTGFILILLLINTVQYFNYESVRTDNKALVEQRIIEQEKSRQDQKALYEAQLMQAASNIATKFQVDKLTEQIQALKEAGQKAKKR